MIESTNNLKGEKLNSVEPVGVDGLPSMTADSANLAGYVKPTKAQEIDVRARENAGLPPVNRRTSNSKLVTILGFIFVLGAVAAISFALNGGKPSLKKKNSQVDQIANNLPALAIPATPPPITVTRSASSPSAGASSPFMRQGAQVPPINLGTSGARPIPLKGANGQPMAVNSKPPLDWTDRKMLGTLLVAQQSGGISSGAASGTGRPAAAELDSSRAPSPAGVNGRPGGGQGELSAKLEPTITNGVPATLLPDRNFLITKGTALDCALETALDSSLPGLTTCRLTRDVYSDNGQVVLLDRGSQLVGEYQGGMKQGQMRLFVLWTRAKTPNGVVVSLNSPSTDALGRSGLDGWVDSHFAERFGAAILMSFIKDTVAALVSRSGGTTNVYGGTLTGGDKIIEKILESTVNIPPTLVKNQGDHIQVMVARDLDFSGIYSLQANK